MSDINDQLVFAKEVSEPKVSKISAWKILIIDDEEEVHHITKYVLRDLFVLDRPLSFLSASSKKEAETILTSTSDIALILLDVVMEEDDSGLKLVKYIREELKNNFVRIILRTGQPGIAPENKIIIDYDINDYKAKTELTAQKLITTIVSSIRSFKDIMTIERNRLGLKRIIEAAPGMYEVQSLKRFASGTLQQVASILDADENAFYCKPQGIQANKTDNEFIVMAGTGKHEKDVDQNLKEVIDSTTLSQIQSVLENKHSKLFDNTFIGYIETKLGNQNLIVLEDIPPLNPLDIELIEIFSMNMAVAFDNLTLNEEIEETQKELFFTLGGFVEQRSKETGNHVKRVAEYTKKLAYESGIKGAELELLYLASAMHDIGKIAIPDLVLNKPAALTKDEMECMKNHSQFGYDLFKFSKRKLFQTAAIVAHEHHEHWLGTGYPQGIKGKDIHSYARITAIADVFDALTSDRIYRKAWTIPETIAYFKEQSGKQFDPDLCSLFLSDIESYILIREKHED